MTGDDDDDHDGPGAGGPGGPGGDGGNGSDGGDDELLIEQVASAYRPLPRDELRYHPRWHDLGAAGRARAVARAGALRALEAALDPDGLSTTARAVLARITGQR
jgi:hypothetical protein